jgi:hypothetical protein
MTLGSMNSLAELLLFQSHARLTLGEGHVLVQAKLVATRQQPKSRFLGGRHNEQ